MIYLDNAATTPVFEDILNNLGKWQREYFANPNSLHPDGQKSRIAVEEARRYFTGLIGCLEEEVVFTSCATESNNTVIKGLAESYPEKNHIIISPIEHKSVLMPVKYLTKKGYKVDFLKIDNHGKIDLDHLRKIITPKTLFVGVIHVNNETGVIQDITEIGKICKGKEVPFFSDTVQSFGKVDIPFEYLDFFSISGHKINAPKGVGLLKINKNIDITPLLHGGGQENGFRSGTENVVGAIALKEATQNWMENKKNLWEKFKRLEKLLINGLRENIPEIKVVSENNKVPYITTVLFPGITGQEMVMALGRKGIDISSGSACSTGSPMPSHVLLAYGFFEKDALSGVRFSFGFYTEEEDIKKAVPIIVETYKKLKLFSDFS